MTTGLNPYLAYCNSGVPWLGPIPAHWQQLPGRACFAERKTPNVGMQETTVLSLSYGQIVVKPPEKLHGLVPASFETYQIIEPYDIVIRPTDLQNDWVSLRTGLARTRGIITSAYMGLRTKDSLAQEYGHLLLHTYDLKKVFYGLGSGLRQNLSWRDFKYLPCLIPPPDEQATIVRFLDYIDRRTRRYIRAQRKLITLLEEQKQAIIQRTVTRGLDPNIRLKPSRVDWLGEIPEHWEIQRLKFLTSHIVDCLHATPTYSDDGEYPAIRTADIVPGRVLTDRAKRIARDQYLLWTSRLRPREGDILYTREGERFGLAAIVPADVELCISQRMMVFRVRDEHHSGFVMWQLNAPHVYAQATQDLLGATSPHVNVERIRNYLLAVPPLSEQIAIAAWIQERVESLDEMVIKAEREINLIREYRTRLIADVVTGKLDVRQAAANLPEEAEEPEDWDADEIEEVGDKDLDEAEVEADE